MNLYLLTRTDDTGYDHAVGFVVAAESAADARACVTAKMTVRGVELDYFKHCGDEGAEPWLTTAICELIGTAICPRGVVLRDFNAG